MFKNVIHNVKAFASVRLCNCIERDKRKLCVSNTDTAPILFVKLPVQEIEKHSNLNNKELLYLEFVVIDLCEGTRDRDT